MGLVTTVEIPYGKTIGPILTKVSLNDPAYLIGHTTMDKYPDIPMTKVDLNILTDPTRVMDWLPAINPARNEKEQNVEVYRKEGKIYYRALRTILADEEILAWYSRDLAASLGIPDVKATNMKDNGNLFCPMCEQTFRHPFSLRAHIVFQCDRRTRLQALPLDMTITARHLTERHGTPHHLLHPSYGRAVGFLGVQLPMDPISFASVYERSSDAVEAPRLTSSIAKDERRLYGIGADILNDVKPKKLSLPEGRAAHVDVERASRKRRWSEEEKSGDEDTDRNQNIRPKSVHDQQERVSPRLMLEHNSPLGSAPSVAHSPQVSPISFPILSECISPVTSQIITSSQKDFMMEHNRFTMLPVFATGRYSENVPIGLADVRAHKNDFVHELRHLESSVQSRLLGERVPYSPHTYSTIKPQNPMVEKLLTAPLVAPPPLMPSPMMQLNVMQNWCAKCNATFRMTSDLVYHMRSHHKREFDPIKRKREEKLKCTICHETFKERHHLTRHMTSHL